MPVLTNVIRDFPLSLLLGIPLSWQTEEPEPAEFELVSYSAPEEVEIGEEFTLKITIKNVGGKTGTYSDHIYVRTPDSDWLEGGVWTFDDVAPGETTTAEVSEPISFDYINRFEYRLGTFSETASIQVVGAQLNWGETFVTPEGYEMRVDKPTFQDTYRYEDWQGNIKEKEPDDRDVWAFAN